MKFHPLDITGACAIETEFITDDRGGFGRLYCPEEMRKTGIDFVPAQINNSYNLKKGTIRGLHYQKGKYAEAKLFRCIRGSVYSVAVDIRPESPTYRKWVGQVLSAEKRNMVYYPVGCAVGYQALVDGCEVIYAVSNPYAPGTEGGIRFDDPAFSIDWPIKHGVILSEKDKNLGSYKL